MQSTFELLSFLRRRGGVYLNRARRSIWVHGRDPEDFEAISRLLRWLRTAVATDRFLLTSARPETCRWLRGRYPNDNVLPPPWSARPLVGRFFRQLRPVMILCIGTDNVLGAAVLEHARRQSIRVVLLDVAAAPPPVVLRYVQHFCVRNPVVATQIAAMNVASTRISITGALRGGRADDSACGDGDAQATIAVVAQQLAAIPEPPGGFRDRTAPRRMDQLARTAVGRLIVATRRGRQIDDFAALRRRLGHPKTILCLGNGPSSEDPRLLDIEHDRLFRVNWRWLERGMLCRPDMVFVGDLQTTARLRGCVFGFRTLAWESEMLLRQVLLHRSLRRLEYFTYERVSQFLSDDAWPAHPTNGVVMVATAAALQPKRLILAGMDLYLDPRGRYPGDPTPENDFPQMHSREVELEILDRVLAPFRGETWILSEPLREALSMRRAHAPAASLSTSDG
jgi:hypothetical protein